eukprot:CAMPEP_0203787864 /NCGR_PEP_ID=MMETSP0100_2-20121128/2490_1 /ASSEMBLY_ACC=CAM_ASM_000210 /TAXON_ID=96639 /ORGANISM=" , Strain NY0313808BC1" /LENGTH=124 /DNA_ID=CAMNT_0050690467 /DNA_START=979 /DNA_END=1349 /DNA_ORIENTATION=+
MGAGASTYASVPDHQEHNLVPAIKEHLEANTESENIKTADLVTIIAAHASNSLTDEMASDIVSKIRRGDEETAPGEISRADIEAWLATSQPQEIVEKETETDQKLAEAAAAEAPAEDAPAAEAP